MKENIINWEDVQQKATEYLCQYLQINTVNPPGKEIEGAHFLKGILSQAGISSTIVESEPGRGNLIARLEGGGEKPPLLLLSHIDVVPAEAEKWIYPPFSGKVVDEEIWGRGALDCKSLGIANAMVLILLKKSVIQLNRDIIMAATADEEKGGTFGAGWLCRNQPGFQDIEAVINEGGGVGIAGKNKNYYFCQVAEKGICWMRIRFTGSPGHGSLPRDDNCILSLGSCLSRIGAFRPEIQLPPVTMQFLKGFSDDDVLAPLFDQIACNPQSADNALKHIKDKGLKQLLGTMLRTTFVPTVVKGGEKTNVIPSECCCEVDCRILPGKTPEKTKKELEALLSDIPRCSIEIIDSSTASESSQSHELYHLFRQSLLRHDPQAKMIPYISSGATDSRFFRNQGAPAFGFAPLLVDGDLSQYQDLIHGHNERISKKNLLFGIKVLYDVVREYSS
ncbi:MAG: M20/M25/M40 family metallo-hydrolase [Proteobacteria bacterium]|nr:M20/M25/M40 family metallo-hydrolase [Pseudomonadota bacterium]